MNESRAKNKFAIIGGGPSALFIFKRLLESRQQGLSVTIFESQEKLGMGMPYGHKGAEPEHITNVSGNEIPSLLTGMMDWVNSLPGQTLEKYGLRPGELTDYRVLPRLLFGDYLSAQFQLLILHARQQGMKVTVLFNTHVTDLKDLPDSNEVVVHTADGEPKRFGHVFICSGHQWPLKKEKEVPGYYDSPYPPVKLRQRFNHPVAIKGSALTAIDAVRTMARANGAFITDAPHKVRFVPAKESAGFRVVLHSLNGLLPGIRFHLEDSHLTNDTMLTREEIFEHLLNNDGFLSLDYVFERDFKDSFKKKHGDFYEAIKDMNMEDFVDMMMNKRESVDAFELFKAEYAESQRSIDRRESVYWKEAIGALSFAMNYPAKHFSAEDMQRLQKTLMPLISIIIAYVPQDSCEELLALYDAGVLQLVPVDKESDAEAVASGGVVYHYTDEAGEQVEKRYETFVNAIGQPHLELKDLPFPSLIKDGTVSAARLVFRSSEKGHAEIENGNKKVEQSKDHYYLQVPGIAITDNFKVISASGYHNGRIRFMAVPFLGGYNPDYSGLDFCEEASKLIVDDLFS